MNSSENNVKKKQKNTRPALKNSKILKTSTSKKVNGSKNKHSTNQCQTSSLSNDNKKKFEENKSSYKKQSATCTSNILEQNQDFKGSFKFIKKWIVSAF